MDTQIKTEAGQQNNRHYLSVWRWHFYAGLLVMPFLTLLAVTGLGMLLFANITGKEESVFTFSLRQWCNPSLFRQKRHAAPLIRRLRPSSNILHRVPMIWLLCSVSTMRVRQPWLRSILIRQSGQHHAAQSGLVSHYG